MKEECQQSSFYDDEPDNVAIRVPYDNNNLPVNFRDNHFTVCLELLFTENEYTVLDDIGYSNALQAHFKYGFGMYQGEEDVISDIDSLKAGKKITQEFQQKVTDEKLKAILQRIEILFDEAIARGTGLYFLM